MQKIIEVIGPPGIGKSTLYKAISNTWTQNSNWTYQESIHFLGKPNFSGITQWLEFQSKKLLGRKLKKSIPTEYGLRFVNNNPDLANFYWDHLADSRVYNSDEIAKRFRSAYFLFNDFCRYQALLESACEKPCLINEGFLQKSFFINKDDAFIHDVIDTYLGLVPLPYAIIYIDTPNRELILERLLNRKKVIASHLEKDDTSLLEDIAKWQYILKLIIEKAQNHRVKILKLDGQKPVSYNVACMQEFLQSI